MLSPALQSAHLQVHRPPSLQYAAKCTPVKRLVLCGSAEAAGSEAGKDAGWGDFTDKVVRLAGITFTVVGLPQVLQNASYISSGSLDALSIISWEGYISGLLGNTLMCSHFANRGEKSAVMVQLVGIANNVAVLSQMAWTQCMPRTVFAVTISCVALAVGMSYARLSNRIPAVSTVPGRLGLWQRWQLVSGVFGLAVVPQVLYNVMVPAHPSFLPGIAMALLLSGWFSIPLITWPQLLKWAQLVPWSKMTTWSHVITWSRLMALTQLITWFQANRSSEAVAQLPGWASTILFALSPLPQLVRNMLDPRGLEGLSVGTMLLALLGNTLMAPRALFVKDPVWLIGASWAIFAGWGQLLGMFLRHAPSGLRYLDPIVFGSVTAAIAIVIISVVTKDAASKDMPGPWGQNVLQVFGLQQGHKQSS